MPNENVAGPSSLAGIKLPPQHKKDPPLAGLICHRAKNDLQTVANLMALAEPYALSAMDLVDAVEGRVGALSVCYSLVAEFNDAPRLSRLADEVLRRVLSRRGSRVLVSNHLEDLPLSLRLCSPLSLWLHEMADNAVGHGLAGQDGGIITVDGGLTGKEFRLTVRDNGRGLPMGFDAGKHGALGLKLAQAVVKSDLRGFMSLEDADPGVLATLCMPRQEFERLSGDCLL